MVAGIVNLFIVTTTVHVRRIMQNCLRLNFKFEIASVCSCYISYFLFQSSAFWIYFMNRFKMVIIWSLWCLSFIVSRESPNIKGFVGKMYTTNAILNNDKSHEEINQRAGVNLNVVEFWSCAVGNSKNVRCRRKIILTRLRLSKCVEFRNLGTRFKRLLKDGYCVLKTRMTC